jgi:hypothetical protein
LKPSIASQPFVRFAPWLVCLALFGCSDPTSTQVPPPAPDPEIEAIKQSGKNPAEIRYMVKKKLRERLEASSPAR